MSKTMTAKKYQATTHKFAVFPERMALEYLTMGLASEAGEVAGKSSKLIRGDYTDIADDPADSDVQKMRVNVEEFHEDLWKEMGDVMWFLSELCNLTGTTLEHLMAQNIKKLEARQKAETLKGSGDNR